jgi:ATP-binding cassette subfamily B protein
MAVSSVSYAQHRRFLLTYLSPQRRRVALLAVLLFTSIGLQLLTPQIVSRFIDAARGGAAQEVLLRLAGVFIAVALTGQVISALAVYASENVGWTATNKVREDLALHCLRLDLPFHNARTPGEMIERVDGDVTQMSTFFSQFTIKVLGNAVLLVGILVLLFREDWRVGCVYTVFTAGALIILRRLMESSIPYFKESRQASAMLLGFLEERLAGTEDIRSSGAVPYVINRFYLRMRDILTKSRRAWLRGMLMWATTAGLLATGNALAFGMGAYLLRHGLITLGTVYLFFHYTEMLRRPLEQITRQMQELQRASAGISRVGDLLALESATRDGAGRMPSGPLAVDAERVSFGYVADDPVLRGISFHLAPGRTLGLLGRTGSGKTTLGRLFVRFYDPTEGEICLGGVDLREAPVAELRSRVGLVTQDVQLFHASARDNLTFFNPAISDRRIFEVLEELGLAAWVRSLPSGLDTQIGPRSLSAGEAQLLAFARVFFKDPGLVILDEASSRLDPATEQLVERAVGALLRGRTAIIIAHRLATVHRADEIMIIDDGRVIEHGERPALAADPDSRFASLLRTGLEEVLA